MSKITSLIRRAPKRLTALVSMVAAAIIVPAAVLAFGPDRPTFTMNTPSDHVALNSITDNSEVGDERNFVSIRPDTGDNGVNNVWTDYQTVTGGQTYVVRMYVHNDAASNLNLVAQNVTASFNLPTTTGKSVQVDGFLSTSNWGANNSGNAGSQYQIYDSAVFQSSQDFNVAYVPGSLKYENNGTIGGSAIPGDTNIFTNAGVKLGYNAYDGKIPGCLQYAGYVTFKVKAQTANNFTFSKMVSQHGANKWSDNYTAQAGEKVDYLLQYKNTSANTQSDVTFRDTLPTGMTYVNGSTTFGNAATPSGVKASDNIANGTGINVGSYLSGANAWAIFSATVPGNDKLACGVNNLVNTAKVNTGGYSLSDTATVTVNKTCQPTYITVCELATKQIVSIDASKFDSTKYSKDLSDCNTPEQITVCELATKQIVKIDANKFDSTKYSKNLSDCKTTVTNITVCELSTKKIVTIDETTFDSAKYSKDLNACATTTTPPELPHTGPTETFVGILGLGAIVASLGYFINSRRALNKVL